MKKLFKNLLTLLLIGLYNISTFAQNGIPPDPEGPIDPNTGGGQGGSGTGSLASPIDMYLYLLMGAAILFLVYFAKKYRRQNSN